MQYESYYDIQDLALENFDLTYTSYRYLKTAATYKAHNENYYFNLKHIKLSKASTAGVRPPKLWNSPSRSRDVPRVRLSTYGGRAFCDAGPSAWKALPDILESKNSTLSLSTFRRQLKRPSAFEIIFLQLTRYINYLLAYLFPSPTARKFATSLLCVSTEQCKEMCPHTNVSDPLASQSQRTKNYRTVLRLLLPKRKLNLAASLIKTVGKMLYHP